MAWEIEGKWRQIEQLDMSQLRNLPHSKIDQGYVAIDPSGSSVRVRHRDGVFTQTTKARSSNLKRNHEVEFELPEKDFMDLWPLTEGRRIEKVRYLSPLIGRHSTYGTAEIDLFLRQLEGLVIVEVEVPTIRQLDALRADPPSWFGIDVTDDKRYSNSSLAVNGIPPLP